MSWPPSTWPASSASVSAADGGPNGSGTTPDVPNFVRKPYGEGWALVGDAGMVMDPITGQGIGHALRDAELLSAALAEGLDGGRPLATTLAEYARKRDHDALPMYDFTTRLASFGPPDVAQDVLFKALAAAEPGEVSRFIGVMTGAVPVTDYLAPANLRRVIGLRGMAKALLSKLGGKRGSSAAP